MNPALTRTSYGDNMRKQRRVLNEQLRAEMVRTVGQDVERQECKALLRGQLHPSLSREHFMRRWTTY